jgi:hypothetical protein
MNPRRRFQQIAGLALCIEATILFLCAIESPNRYIDVAVGVVILIVGIGALGASKRPDSN